MDLKRLRTVAFEGAHLVPEPSTILLLALATQELALSNRHGSWRALQENNAIIVRRPIVDNLFDMQSRAC